MASLAVRAAAAVAGFVANVAIARALGVSGSGTYFLAITILTAFAVLGRAGTDVAAVRAIAALLSRDDPRRGAAVEAWAWTRVFRWSLVAWAALAAFATFLAPAAFGEPRLRLALIVASAATVPIAVLSLLAEVLRARGRVTWGAAIQSLLTPMLLLAGIALLLRIGASDPALATAMYSAATIVSGFVGWLLVRRLRGTLRGEASRLLSAVEIADLRASSTTFMIISLQNLLISLTDIVMLGAIADASAVGLYSVALRTTSLGNLVLASVNSAVGPRFAAHAEAGDRDALVRLARASTRAMAAAAVMIVTTLVALREPILALFGQDFAAGQGAFVVLSLGQLIVLGTGPVAYLLMMSGHQRFHRNGLAIAAIANIALNALLIPPFGILGAAVATSASLGVKNLVSLVYVRLRLGFWVLP